MLYQLINLEKYMDMSEEISLDDFSSGSSAIYFLKNPECLKVNYCCPDRAEGMEGGQKTGKGQDPQRKEPRCDYLLYISQVNLVKFVELKGIDSKDTNHSCCSTSWEHGFHQLEATYEAYRSFLDQRDTAHFILCTVLPPSRISDRYKSYTRYRRLRESAKVSILGADEWDELPKTTEDSK